MTNQQSDATTVVVVVKLVDAVLVFVAKESGCPVCAAPVYDPEMPAMTVDAEAVMTTLFDPVAGATKYQSVTHRLSST